MGLVSQVNMRKFSGLTAQSTQIALAASSFTAAVALLAIVVFAPGTLDRPVGIGIALLLALNGCGRILLWRNRSRLP